MTLSDTINVPPVAWRDGSLTQRLADLFRNGADGGGSSIYTAGIVRGFEVYPTADDSTVILKGNQTSGDSLVVITAADGSSAIQYRLFDDTTNLEVDMSASDAGIRFLAFRPDFATSTLQLVTYSEAEFIAGDLTTDEAVLIAAIQDVNPVAAKGIGYFGTFVNGGSTYSFARGRVYNEELVEQEVVDFGVTSAANVQFVGENITATTALVGSDYVLRLTATGAGAVRIPFYQYMDPDTRVGAYLGTASKVRAIVEVGAVTGDVLLEYVLNDATNSNDSTFLYGSAIANTANVGTTGGFFPIEIHKEGPILWGTLRIGMTIDDVIDIKSITLEVDRFRPWAIGGTKSQNIVPRAVQYSSSATDYVRIGNVGLEMGNGTKSTTIKAEEWVLSTPDPAPADAYEITFTPESIEMVNDTNSITIDVNAASIAMEATGAQSTEIKPDGIQILDIGGDRVLATSELVAVIDSTNDVTVILRSSETSIGNAVDFDVPLEITNGKFTFNALDKFGSLYQANDADQNFILTQYVDNAFGWSIKVSGDVDDLCDIDKFGVVVEGTSTITTIRSNYLQTADLSDSSTIEPDAITTTGLFTGLNAPIGVGVAVFNGDDWVFNAAASSGVFTGLFGATNSATGFIFSCTATTNLGVIATASGKETSYYVKRVYAGDIEVSTTVVAVDVSNNSTVDDYVTVLLFGS